MSFLVHPAVIINAINQKIGPHSVHVGLTIRIKLNYLNKLDTNILKLK